MVQQERDGTLLCERWADELLRAASVRWRAARRMLAAALPTRAQRGAWDTPACDDWRSSCSAER